MYVCIFHQILFYHIQQALSGKTPTNANRVIIVPMIVGMSSLISIFCVDVISFMFPVTSLSSVFMVVLWSFETVVVGNGLVITSVYKIYKPITPCLFMLIHVYLSWLKRNLDYLFNYIVHVTFKNEIWHSLPKFYVEQQFPHFNLDESSA